MRAQAFWPLLLSFFIASLFRSAFSLANGRLKQATRSEIVHRLSKDDPRAPKPRRSSGPCVTPSGTAPMAVDAGCSGSVSCYPLSQYYSGAGFTETSNNPGNHVPGFLPITTTIAYTDVADAVQQCADTLATEAANYESFDLSFLKSTCSFRCTAYYNPNNGENDASYFNVANSDVLLGYGYTV